MSNGPSDLNKKLKILTSRNRNSTDLHSNSVISKKEMKKYAAANAGELKVKHPEAHRLYQQYVGNVRANGGNIRVRLKSDAP